jgi:hypothetical protein
MNMPGAQPNGLHPFTIRYDTLAANPDIGLERLRQSHELVSGSQMEPEDIANPDLATGDMEVLCHGK